MALAREQAQAIADALVYPTQAFIDDGLCDTSDGGVFETINPATAEVIAGAAHCTALEVDRAVVAARRSKDRFFLSNFARYQRGEPQVGIADLAKGY